MDPIDQLLRDEAPPGARAVALLDAPGLVEFATGLTEDVRVWCDDWRDAQRVPASMRVGPDALAGVDLALGRLPKSLDALEQQVVALGDDPGLTYLGGARIKHLNRSMNETLGRHFPRCRRASACGSAGCCAPPAPGRRPPRDLGRAPASMRGWG